MNTISETSSLEEAFETQKKLSVRLGRESAERIRENPSNEEFTLQYAFDYYVNGNRKLGIDTSGKIESNTVHLVMKECPVYDGLKAAGFTDEMVERFCHNGYFEKHPELSP